MSTPIRVDGINSPACPRNTEACHYDITHFQLTVQKGDAGGGVARPWYVHTWGLEGKDQLIIERVKKENCDPMFSPLYCGGRPMCLTEEFPETVLTMPGTYRFRFSDDRPINYDDDFAVEMGEVKLEYAQLWLQQQQLHCCLASN